MNLLHKVHGGFIYPRRIFQLSRKIIQLLPPQARVLDVGCGDGLLSSEITKLRPDVQLEGIDVLVRKKTFIPVMRFDGAKIPHPDASFDVVMFVDVLHHTIDPGVLLREAKRVTRKMIVVKDHTCNGLLAGPRLRLMDRVGNARYGVVLPYNYWTREKWHAELKTLGIYIESWVEDLDLYPWWADWIFGNALQFMASLTRCARSSARIDRSTPVVLSQTFADKVFSSRVAVPQPRQGSRKAG
jgi:SAM-dependent methyltransferase